MPIVLEDAGSRGQALSLLRKWRRPSQPYVPRFMRGIQAMLINYKCLHKDHATVGLVSQSNLASIADINFLDAFHAAHKARHVGW